MELALRTTIKFVSPICFLLSKSLELEVYNLEVSSIAKTCLTISPPGLLVYLPISRSELNLLAVWDDIRTNISKNQRFYFYFGQPPQPDYR